jgi:hypothetical protein
VLAVLSATAIGARDLSSDEFFIVASKSRLSGVTILGSPSVNDSGDIVARFTTPSGTEHRVFLFTAQTNNPPIGNTPSILARSHANTLGSLPLINNNKAVVSSLSFTMGNQNIMRLDFDAGASSYSSVPIARANVTQVQPFSFLSPIAALDDQTPPNAYFYGERTPPGQSLNRRIYRSSDEVTTPATETAIASYPDVFSTLETYVAASSNMHVVYRGTRAGQLGIYKNDANIAVATPALDFPTTGTRPAINSLNTVAFYGIYTGVSPQLPGIFLAIQGESSPRRVGNLATRTSSESILTSQGVVPSSYSSSDRVAFNDHGLVAFLGTDSDGNQSIFTTVLGQLRKLISVGDRIRSPVNSAWVSISSLALYSGLGIKGQVTFLANTSDGDQLILLANRAYNQRSTLYSPIVPSYRGTQYLLRSVPNSGWEADPQKMISWVGCNLVSTVNILNSHGATTSPMEFQSWLIDHRDPYIGPKNDLTEAAVEAFSQYLISQQKARTVIRFRGWHRTANGSNLSKIISELRAGRPVKLRVPSSSRYGHYIMAYAIIDPSKPDAQLTPADILIADPGKSPAFTLAAYGQLVSPQQSPLTYDQVWGAAWIEDEGSNDGQRRVHLYDADSQPSLAISGHSPIQLVVRDSQGRRAGFSTSTGTLRELPGSDYYEEISYHNFDEIGESSEPAWGTTEAVKHILISGASVGDFSLDIIGTGSGSYAVTIYGNGGATPTISSLSGIINKGETRTITFGLRGSQPSFLQPLITTTNIVWTVVGDPQKPIVIEESTNLVHWSASATPPITNGIGSFRMAVGSTRLFVRAVRAD